METRVGLPGEGEPEQLDSSARAQTDARTALHLRLPNSECAMFAILQRCGISNTVTAVSMLAQTAVLRGGTIRGLNYIKFRAYNNKPEASCEQSATLERKARLYTHWIND